MPEIPPNAITRIFELVARGYEPHVAAMIAKREEEKKANG